MTAPQPRRTTYDDPIDAELSRWPGVTWRREVRGKHYALVLDFNGLSRFNIYPSTPNGSSRGPLNQIRDLRATLKDMGATRLAEPKSKRPQRARNRTEPSVVNLGERAERDPSRDCWAALSIARRKIVDQAPFVLPIRVEGPGLWARVWEAMDSVGLFASLRPSPTGGPASATDREVVE